MAPPNPQTELTKILQELIISELKQRGFDLIEAGFDNFMIYLPHADPKVLDKLKKTLGGLDPKSSDSNIQKQIRQVLDEAWKDLQKSDEFQNSYTEEKAFNDEVIRIIYNHILLELNAGHDINTSDEFLQDVKEMDEQNFGELQPLKKVNKQKIQNIFDRINKDARFKKRKEEAVKKRDEPAPPNKVVQKLKEMMSNDYYYVWWIVSKEDYKTLLGDPHVYPRNRGTGKWNYKELGNKDIMEALRGDRSSGKVEGRFAGDLGIIARNVPIISTVPHLEIKENELLVLGAARAKMFDFRTRQFRGITDRQLLEFDVEQLIWKWFAWEKEIKGATPLKSKDSPKIESISNPIYTGNNINVVLKGNHLDKVEHVNIFTEKDVKLTDYDKATLQYKYIPPNSATIIIPPSLKIGEYKLEITDKEGEGDKAPFEVVSASAKNIIKITKLDNNKPIHINELPKTVFIEGEHLDEVESIEIIDEHGNISVKGNYTVNSKSGTTQFINPHTLADLKWNCKNSAHAQMEIPKLKIGKYHLHLKNQNVEGVKEFEVKQEYKIFGKLVRLPITIRNHTFETSDELKKLLSSNQSLINDVMNDDSKYESANTKTLMLANVPEKIPVTIDTKGNFMINGENSSVKIEGGRLTVKIEVDQFIDNRIHYKVEMKNSVSIPIDNSNYLILFAEPTDKLTFEGIVKNFSNPKKPVPVGGADIMVLQLDKDRNAMYPAGIKIGKTERNGKFEIKMYPRFTKGYLLAAYKKGLMPTLGGYTYLFNDGQGSEERKWGSNANKFGSPQTLVLRSRDDIVIPLEIDKANKRIIAKTPEFEDAFKKDIIHLIDVAKKLKKDIIDKKKSILWSQDETKKILIAIRIILLELVKITSIENNLNTKMGLLYNDCNRIITEIEKHDTKDLLNENAVNIQKQLEEIIAEINK